MSCQAMYMLGRVSCEAYRSVVFSHPRFLSYFRQATPEEELGNLNIGESCLAGDTCVSLHSGTAGVVFQGPHTCSGSHQQLWSRAS